MLGRDSDRFGGRWQQVNEPPAIPSREPAEGATAEAKRRGTLFVMTGASGVGKDSIRRVAIPQLDDIYFSVSATTRARRPGEREGLHYFYVDRPRFESMLAAGELLEHADYVGDYYGTPLAPVENTLAAGGDVLLELELVGARQVKERLPEAVMVFIAPPSLAELERRLRGRGTDDEAKIQKRLARARDEIRAIQEFDYLIVNDDLSHAVELFVSIIRAERARTSRLNPVELARLTGG